MTPPQETRNGFTNIVCVKQEVKSLSKNRIRSVGCFQTRWCIKWQLWFAVSVVGYATFEKRRQLVRDKKINLRSILLKEDTQLLNEVQVVGQRSQMKFEIDRKVFNVDQSLATAGGSASDVLGNIPSVQVDPEGEVSSW